MQPLTPAYKPLRDRRIYFALISLILIGFYYFAFSPPKNFPSRSIVDLRQGAGLMELSQTLEEAHIIRSARWFRVVAILLGGEKITQAGDYYLENPENTFHLAWRMVHAYRDLALVKITIPEGFTVKEISSLFDSRFPLFDHLAFENGAPEGFLFPDTYFVYINASASSTIGFFEDNFHKKVDPLASEIKASGHSLSNLMVVASLLEAEVKTPADKALVSGIIWKRLSKDMLLQVDSAPGTYKTKGLPPAPINNPGLVSIKAAIHPTDSPYLYFISDKQGQIHYAKTLDEQTANIQKYL